VVTRLSDEGLVIELFDTPEQVLFAPDKADPSPILYDLAAMLVDVTALATNRIAISGHVRAYPITLRADPTWDLSTARAQILREMLGEAGLDPARMQRVTGFADRRPATADPTSIRNNRIEVTLLRRQSAIGGI
jgi:chemotaxis protein MotB